jgi:hypothetical protein
MKYLFLRKLHNLLYKPSLCPRSEARVIKLEARTGTAPETRGSSGGIVTRYGFDGLDSISGRGKILVFVSAPQCTDRFWGPFSVSFNDSSVAKRSERDAEPSFPPSAEAKNGGATSLIHLIN